MPELVDVAILPDGDAFAVIPVWSGVDRTSPSSTLVTNQKHAERLAQAFRLGLAYTDLKTATDVNNRTYPSYTRLFTGRTLEADLKRMGI